MVAVTAQVQMKMDTGASRDTPGSDTHVSALLKGKPTSSRWSRSIIPTRIGTPIFACWSAIRMDPQWLDSSCTFNVNVTSTVSPDGNIFPLVNGASRPPEPKVVGMKSQISLWVIDGSGKQGPSYSQTFVPGSMHSTTGDLAPYKGCWFEVHAPPWSTIPCPLRVSSLTQHLSYIFKMHHRSLWELLDVSGLVDPIRHNFFAIVGPLVLDILLYMTSCWYMCHALSSQMPVGLSTGAGKAEWWMLIQITVATLFRPEKRKKDVK